MARALSSYFVTAEKREAIERRIANKTLGLGYWAAVDAQKVIRRQNAPYVQGAEANDGTGQAS